MTKNQAFITMSRCLSTTSKSLNSVIEQNSNLVRSKVPIFCHIQVVYVASLSTITCLTQVRTSLLRTLVLCFYLCLESQNLDLRRRTLQMIPENSCISESCFPVPMNQELEEGSHFPQLKEQIHTPRGNQSPMTGMEARISS